MKNAKKCKKEKKKISNNNQQSLGTTFKVEVELILQGDDVTRQMWHMYSVFEEIFGRQTMTTSSNQPLKHVVVGDKIKSSSASASPTKHARATPTSPLATSPLASKATAATTTSVPTSTITVTTSAITILSSPTNSTISTSSPKDKDCIVREQSIINIA
ncbi:uncharacterized protein CEXT_287931 [Caerostris extrusa]|uniref:Uncharacterized protein n=1 Tax=Caerostris extrusa TaxID=172846 RepID=A0AAV4UXS6_CAEEX|nr:uncharacterized protein CEXT_287931 [Caerostris extrusa]